MRSFRRLFSRRVSAALVVTLAASGTTGCEFITGVPEVGSVELTVAPPSISVGTESNATAVSKKSDGTVITHRKRVPRLSSTNPAVATVTAGGRIIAISEGTTEIVAEADGKSDRETITVLPARPANVTFSPEFPQVFVNETLPVVIRAFNNTGAEITGFAMTCSVANPIVAAVTATGNTCAVRGLVAGNTTVLVNVNGIDRSVTVTVQQTRIAKVVADIRRPIREGEVVPIQITLLDANNVSLPTAGRGLAFVTSDPTVATVNNQGVVSAGREGTAIITTVTEGDLRDTSLVQVTKLPVARVEVRPENAQFRLGIQGRGVQAFPIDSLERVLPTAGRRVTYTSLDTTVLRVGLTGVVTPLRIGATRIIGEVDGVVDTTDVRVTEIPTARVVIDTNLVQRFPGETFQYTATVYDSLNNVVTGRQVRWTSSNPVVQINPTTGLARAVGAGTSTIRLEVTRVSGFPEVVVDDASFQVLQTPVARIEVAPETLILKVGETRIINVTALDANGLPLFGRTILPTPTPAGIATSGGVQSDGTATVRALAEGTATITYRAFNQFNQPEGTTAQLRVTVTP